uniref:Uncharacterized protein n=1 Tax=Arion vulgaris TaxID=1028688 RepID=A0A0B6ZSK0_9EUPU
MKHSISQVFKMKTFYPLTVDTYVHLQVILIAAFPSMVSHIVPHYFISLSTVLHISFSLPLLLLPSVVHWKVVFNVPGGILHTCPSRLHLLFVEFL